MPRLALAYPLGFAIVLAAGALVLIPSGTPAVEHARIQPPAPAPPPLPPMLPRDEQPLPDLDGDGVPERFDTIRDTCGTGGCGYRVYIKGHYVGEIDGFSFATEPRAGGGPPDVHATWRLGAGWSITTRYRYAHGRYHARGEIECDQDDCKPEKLIRR